MVSLVRVISVAIWGIGWWLVLTQNIGMLSHHIPYSRDSWAVLSLVLSGLKNETRMVRHSASVTARTSWRFRISRSSNLLVKVDRFAFVFVSSMIEYMPPLEFSAGLILSASLGLGSSHALDCLSHIVQEIHGFLCIFAHEVPTPPPPPPPPPRTWFPITAS